MASGKPPENPEDTYPNVGWGNGRWEREGEPLSSPDEDLAAKVDAIIDEGVSGEPDVSIPSPFIIFSREQTHDEAIVKQILSMTLGEIKEGLKREIAKLEKDGNSPNAGSISAASAKLFLEYRAFLDKNDVTACIRLLAASRRDHIFRQTNGEYLQSSAEEACGALNRSVADGIAPDVLVKKLTELDYLRDEIFKNIARWRVGNGVPRVLKKRLACLAEFRKMDNENIQWRIDFKERELEMLQDAYRITTHADSLYDRYKALNNYIIWLAEKGEARGEA